MAKKQLEGSLLENSALFSGLDLAALDGLARLGRSVELKPGQVLFKQGDTADGCYAIVDGLLKVSAVSTEGEEALLAMVGDGDVIGEMALIDGAPRSATVTAQKPCWLAFLSARDFDRFAEANPSVYRHMLQVISTRLRVSNDAFAAYQLLPLDARLARVMVRLAEEFGERLTDGRVLIRQNFTQADLGKMSGSARENVSRQLNEWRRKDMLSRISSYYCIEDMDAFRDLGKL